MKMELGSIFLNYCIRRFPEAVMKMELGPYFLIKKYPAIPRSRNENGARFDFFKIIVSGDSQK